MYLGLGFQPWENSIMSLFFAEELLFLLLQEVESGPAEQ